MQYIFVAWRKENRKKERKKENLTTFSHTCDHVCMDIIDVIYSYSTSILFHQYLYNQWFIFISFTHVNIFSLENLKFLINNDTITGCRFAWNEWRRNYTTEKTGRRESVTKYENFLLFQYDLISVVTFFFRFA